MLGIHDLPKSAPEIAPRKRAATRSLLTMTMASVAFFAVANAAQAKDCVGGYRMIKDEIPIACDAAFDESAVDQTVPVASEPLTTGSINRVEPPSAASIDEPPAMSPGGMKCVGGHHWRPGVENSYTTLPMPCDRM
jgi:hypothetical protein